MVMDYLQRIIAKALRSRAIYRAKFIPFITGSGTSSFNNDQPEESGPETTGCDRCDSIGRSGDDGADSSYEGNAGRSSENTSTGKGQT